jgi:heptosyltransferase-3
MVEFREEVMAALRGRERPAVTVVRAGGLGDTILVLPVLELVRSTAPRAELTLVGSAWAERLVPLLPAPVRILGFDAREMTPLFVRGAVRDPAGAFAGADLAVLYTADAEEPLVENAGRLCPGRTIHWPVDPAGACHAAAHFAAALTKSPPDMTELGGPSLVVPPEASAPAEEWLRERFAQTDGPVAVHPGSGGRRKCWPAIHFAQVARSLGHPLLLLEGPADAEACSRTAELIGSQVPTARAAGLTVGEGAALLHRCRLYLGNDSGMSHLAASLCVPTVAVFGMTDPQVWRPLGPSVVACGGLTTWPEPEEVAEACRQMLRLDLPVDAE